MISPEGDFHIFHTHVSQRDLQYSFYTRNLDSLKGHWGQNTVWDLIIWYMTASVFTETRIIKKQMSSLLLLFLLLFYITGKLGFIFFCCFLIWKSVNDWDLFLFTALMWKLLFHWCITHITGLVIRSKALGDSTYLQPFYFVKLWRCNDESVSLASQALFAGSIKHRSVRYSRPDRTSRSEQTACWRGRLWWSCICRTASN